MKRWLASLFIAVYLGALSWGIVSHAISFGTAAHPVMYYLVWDMFCGWSSFSGRLQIIGEGESGKYYELAPGPWGEFTPFGSLGRRHYDVFGNHTPRLARNVLKHTRHEPINRIFVVEECWAKKYNLPNKLWNRMFDYPKDLRKYYNIRHVFTPEGMMLHSQPTWMSNQFAINLGNNPRLQVDSRRGKPFFAFNYQNRSRGTYTPGTFYDPDSQAPAGSRLGN